ncbi:hypothetical protein OIU84_003347 [Salix udensis]|uniref:ribose-5-phosphate isomerase n=1 Tax=Salix udensis TaxID=889485 RepID=A0AAD6K7L4_9ROSI|nr:hypothetical protein OIU84_003347 [Salix udensis]
MASLATSTLVYSTPVRIKTSSKPGSSSRNCKKTVPFPVTRADSSSLLLDAAKYTVDKHIQSGMVVGLGSGQASGMAIQYLGRLLRAGALKDVVGVPMSVTSASEAAKAGIPLDGYQDSSQIDFAFDDADIIEEETLVAIIGRQKSQADESIIQEKSILILVQALNWMETAEEIEDLFLGDAEVWRRSSIGQADPMGGDFPLITRSLAEVAESLDKVDGVVDHGVISKLPCTVVIAAESGGLNIVDR